VCVYVGEWTQYHNTFYPSNSEDGVGTDIYIAPRKTLTIQMMTAATLKFWILMKLKKRPWYGKQTSAITDKTSPVHTKPGPLGEVEKQPTNGVQGEQPS